MPSEVNANLRQKCGLGPTREYHLLNGQNLRIAIGKRENPKVYTIPILAIADKSRQRLHIAWAWFWLVMFSLIGMLLYGYLKSMLGLGQQVPDTAVMSVFMIAGISGLVMLALNFSIKRVYYTAFSRVPLFDILIGKPDRNSYKEFIGTLESYMQKSRSAYNLRPEQQIAGELRTLRRLTNEGLIPKRVYESAKGKMYRVNNARARAAN